MRKGIALAVLMALLCLSGCAGNEASDDVPASPVPGFAGGYPVYLN